MRKLLLIIACLLALFSWHPTKAANSYSLFLPAVHKDFNQIPETQRLALFESFFRCT